MIISNNSITTDLRNLACSPDLDSLVYWGSSSGVRRVDSLGPVHLVPYLVIEQDWGVSRIAPITRGVVNRASAIWVENIFLHPLTQSEAVPVRLSISIASARQAITDRARSVDHSAYTLAIRQAASV